MKKNAQAYDLTEGVIWKKLLRFFLPIAVGTLFQQLYNTVDAMVVGKFVGTQALAAVGGSAAQVIMLTIGFFVALTGGASAVISQLAGAKREREVSEAVHSAMAFSVVAGLVMSLIGIPLTPAILAKMQTPADTMAESVLYLRIIFAGSVFLLLFNMASSILRSVGDSKRPLYYLIVCCVCNILLDLFFVIVLRMGIAGVACATVISQALSTVLVLVRLCRADEMYKLSLSQLRIHRKVMNRMFKIGIPAGIQASMYNISNLIIQVAINTLNTAVVAGWTMAGKIDGIYCALCSALGVAVMGFVGQNYGAGKMDRVRKTLRDSLVLSAILTFALSAFVLFTGKYGTHFFIDDPEVVAYTFEILLYFAPFYVIWTTIEVISGFLRGVGDALIPLIITAVGICGLRLLWVALVFPTHRSIAGVTTCYPISWVLTAIALVIYYKHCKVFRETQENLQ